MSADCTNRARLEIRGSINDGSLDGLERSFLSTGRSLDDPAYTDFRALVAFGRVTAFDFATSVFDRLIENTTASIEQARLMLQRFKSYMELHERTIGDEIIVDFFNTVQDGTPFNEGDDPKLVRGVTGNVASVVQAFAAFQLVTRDPVFEPFLLTLLFGSEEQAGLLDRQVLQRGSPLHGFFLSRPSSALAGPDPPPTIAIMENNFRVLDSLGLSFEAISDRELKARLQRRYELLREALRREFVAKPVDQYTEAVDVTGPVSNHFNSQDLYTIAGVFLLRQGEIAKARQAIEFLDQKFVVSHRPSDVEATPCDISNIPQPSLQDCAYAGVAFFIGNDDAGDLIGSKPPTPIFFDDPTIRSHQTEATLDYMLFVHEYAQVVTDPAEKSYAQSRFDLMAYWLVALYNEFSLVGLLPVSSRAIPELFTSLEGSLPTEEAIIIGRARAGHDPQHIYRGFRPSLLPLPEVGSFAGGDGQAFALATDGELWRFRASEEVWVPSGGWGVEIVVGNTGDGNPHNDIVFLRSADGRVWTWNQMFWTFTGGWLPSLVAGDNQAFGIGFDGQLWRYRMSGSGAGWTASGGWGVEISVGSIADADPDNDIVFLRGADSRIWTWDQRDWHFTGGWLKSMVAADEQMFGLGFDGQVWRYRVNGGWRPSGGWGVEIVVTNIGDRNPENDIVVLRGADSRVWSWNQTSWHLTGGWLPSLVVGDNQVFAIGFDSKIWRYRLSGPSAGWNSGRSGVRLSIGNTGDDDALNDLVFILFAEGSISVWDQAG